MNGCTIIGIGGAGLSLAQQACKKTGGRFIAINTDRQALKDALVEQSLVIGPKSCGGMGATSPTRGRQAAEESLEEIKALLAGSGEVVLMAGLGGGAGTGALPIIAREVIQRERKLLIAVTLPLRLEAERRRIALEALESLKNIAATVIVHDLAEETEPAASLNSMLALSGKNLATRTHTWLKGPPDA